jgi:hypothetical protein
MDKVSELRVMIAKAKTLFCLIEVGLLANRSATPPGFYESGIQTMLKVGEWDQMLDDIKNDPDSLLSLDSSIEDIKAVLRELEPFWPVAIDIARPVFPELFERI